MYILSVKDIIKKSVLESFSGSLSSVDMVISLVLAFAIGVLIIYVYKKTFNGVVYSKSFSLCILLLSMVTAMIIRTISSNIGLSLGMVGALSIVRFRTAVKDPIDTGFMFWSIAAGIMCGAGMYLPAVVASLLIGVLYFGVYLLGFRASNKYLLVLKYKVSSNDSVIKKLKTLNKIKIRSKSIYGDTAELSIDVNIKESKTGIGTKILDDFNSVDGIINASLVSYQNDFGD